MFNSISRSLPNVERIQIHAARIVACDNAISELKRKWFGHCENKIDDGSRFGLDCIGMTLINQCPRCLAVSDRACRTQDLKRKRGAALRAIKQLSRDHEVAKSLTSVIKHGNNVSDEYEHGINFLAENYDPSFDITDALQNYGVVGYEAANGEFILVFPHGYSVYPSKAAMDYEQAYDFYMEYGTDESPCEVYNSLVKTKGFEVAELTGSEVEFITEYYKFSDVIGLVISDYTYKLTDEQKAVMLEAAKNGEEFDNPFSGDIEW